MPEIVLGLRVVADPDVLDAVVWPSDAVVLRIAPDDVFLLGEDSVEIADPHAIVEPETMYAGTWLDRVDAEGWVAANAGWLLPEGDGFSQGMVAALPVKILAQGERALVLVPTSLAHELELRLRHPGPSEESRS